MARKFLFVPHGRCDLSLLIIAFRSGLLPAYSWFVKNRDMHIILARPRLALRQFTEDDVDSLFDLNNDPE